MNARRTMRRTLPIVLLGAAATVILRRRLMPRPALPPGDPWGSEPTAAVVDDTVHVDAIAEQSAAVAGAGEPLRPPEIAPAPTRSEGRFVERLRRAPVDIVTVVDDLLGAAR